MSFFVLQREATANLGSFRSLHAQAERTGLHLGSGLRVGSFLLSTFRSLSQSDPCEVHFPDGDFALSFGLLTYRGISGIEALTKFHAKFDINNFDWKNLAGTYVILLQKDGIFYAVNDGLGACKLYHDSGLNVLSNSFLAVLCLQDLKSFNVQGCFEYVFAGSCYGTKTF